jgi:hypothetical protein
MVFSVEIYLAMLELDNNRENARAVVLHWHILADLVWLKELYGTDFDLNIFASFCALTSVFVPCRICMTHGKLSPRIVPN